MITIKEVKNKKQLKHFVMFPFSLYKDSPYWVPPLISEEMEGFNKEKNPAFENADATFYLAYKGDEIVGRIAVIINWLEVKKQNLKKVRFGWFDYIDDKEVSKALLEKVFEKGKNNNFEYAEGPMGFSNLDKVGVQISGFEHLGSMITWYNHPYYKSHLEDLGFVPEKEYIESKFSFDNVKSSAPFYKADKLIRERYQLKVINFKTPKDVIPYVNNIFDLFNQSYSSLSSFVEVTESQKEYFKKKYIGLINPEYIKYIVDKDDKLVAFSIVMPSFSEALQKANGKLLPFGFYHLLKAKKNSETVYFYLIGILPEYQNKGVTAIIFKEYFESFKKFGVKDCIQTPQLASNSAILNLWRNFNPIEYARRRTYRKDF